MNHSLLKGINIYLIGIMGAGKSTVGKHLAQKLEYRFFDTDSAIETIAKRSISKIFATEGEAYFREFETKVLAEFSLYTKCVIATGGGIVEKSFNWSYLRHGLVIWLDVERQILEKRLSEDNSRPLAAKLETLLDRRKPLYAQADLTISIDIEQSPEIIASRIVDLIPTVVKSS
jgi:shikimate kinase